MGFREVNLEREEGIFRRKVRVFKTIVDSYENRQFSVEYVFEEEKRMELRNKFMSLITWKGIMQFFERLGRMRDFNIQRINIRLNKSKVIFFVQERRRQEGKIQYFIGLVLGDIYMVIM